MKIIGTIALLLGMLGIVASGKGGAGDKKPRPPRAAPIPRPYKIHPTKHVVQREHSDRAITPEMVETAIRTGQAIPTMEIGEHGGDKFKFHKAITIVTPKGQRIYRKVVVIEEVLEDECWVITTYNEN